MRLIRSPLPTLARGSGALLIGDVGESAWRNDGGQHSLHDPDARHELGMRQRRMGPARSSSRGC